MRRLGKSVTATLSPSLRLVARVAAPARDPWWIIGSAAIALHGIDPHGIGDIDLLMSASDTAALVAAQGIAPAPGVPDDRFRSAVFDRWTAGGMTVETMGGLEVAGPAGWEPTLPATRESIRRGDAALFIPARRELAALLRRFGRPKGLTRAGLLD